ncbi:hydrolase [Peribacillus alkalitolerans]|uniref:hydrolase n=1 Tax=Peribacillus alkalitolerans TaxID=1550385 RepID=UPI0013D561FB|nr:hydrolase [Peribacillus alkalitolerans]
MGCNNNSWDNWSDRDRNRNRNVNRCNGCICDQLRRLDRDTEVDVFLKGGQILEDVVFIRFNRNNCCAFFDDPVTEPGTTLIVDCQDIQALRIE